MGKMKNYEVKLLDWKKNVEGNYWYAVIPFGEYMVSIAFCVYFNGKKIMEERTTAECKQAAQSHWEQLIKECLINIIY